MKRYRYTILIFALWVLSWVLVIVMAYYLGALIGEIAL